MHARYAKIRIRRAAWPLALGAAVVAGVVLAAPDLSAQDAPPLVTDRPDQTESTAVVSPGFAQLELGWTVSEASDGVEEVRAHTLPEALVRIGVLPRVELRVGLPSWSSVEAEVEDSELRMEGLGDASLGLKLGLVEGGGRAPSLALLGGTTIPTGEEGVGSERADPSFRLAASGDLGERLSLGVNVGVQWATESVAGPADGPAVDTGADFLYTAALGIAMTDRVGLFLESFGFAGLEASRAARHSLDGGFTVLIAPNLQLDVRAGAGVDDDAEDWFLGAGFALRLPR